MATRTAVTTALRLLARIFVADITPERVQIYEAALEDVSDEALERATVRLIRTRTGQFFPVPADIRQAAGANGGGLVDGTAALHRIAALSVYNPRGYRHPAPRTVAERIGQAEARAYGAIGPERLFSEHEVTRDIALRDFQLALERAVADGAPLGGLLPPERPVPFLTAAPRREDGAPSHIGKLLTPGRAA